MAGYAVWVEGPAENRSKMLFVEGKDTEAAYPIPSAFRAYMKYMDMRLEI